MKILEEMHNKSLPILRTKNNNSKNAKMKLKRKQKENNRLKKRNTN